LGLLGLLWASEEKTLGWGEQKRQSTGLPGCGVTAGGSRNNGADGSFTGALGWAPADVVAAVAAGGTLVVRDCTAACFRAPAASDVGALRRTCRWHCLRVLSQTSRLFFFRSCFLGLSRRVALPLLMKL
jgi:hypothetical protein